MAFPLQKNITTDATLPRMLSRNQIASSSVSLIANLTIAGLFALTAAAPDMFPGNKAVAFCSGKLVIPMLFAVATMLYLANGRQIMRMPEPSILKELAAHPILPQVREAWKDKLIRKQLLVGFILNMVFITIIPVNLIAVKKGCGMSNTAVQILTTVQLVSMIPVSRLYRFVVERFGPRKMMILTCPVVWLFAAYWYFVPVEKSFFLLIPLFVLASLIAIGFSTSLGNYFIMAAPNHLQVGGSFLIFWVHGGLVGIVGIVANPLLFGFIGNYTVADSMESFRLYYLITGAISLLFIFAPMSLPVKYLEYRERMKKKSED